MASFWKMKTFLIGTTIWETAKCSATRLGETAVIAYLRMLRHRGRAHPVSSPDLRIFVSGHLRCFVSTAIALFAVC